MPSSRSLANFCISKIHSGNPQFLVPSSHHASFYTMGYVCTSCQTSYIIYHFPHHYSLGFLDLMIASATWPKKRPASAWTILVGSKKDRRKGPQHLYSFAHSSITAFGVRYPQPKLLCTYLVSTSTWLTGTQRGFYRGIEGEEVTECMCTSHQHLLHTFWPICKDF
jgi:hypothetical protein